MIIGLLTSNQIVLSICFVILNLWMYYALGRTIQNYFQFKVSNNLLALPLGFFSYFILNFIAFSLLVFLQLNEITFRIVAILLDMFIIFTIALYYRTWMPNFNLVDKNTLVYGVVNLLLIVVSVVIYLLLFTYVPTQDHESLRNGVENLYNTEPDNPFVFNTGLALSSNIAVIEKYESFYYWGSIKDFTSHIDSKLFWEIVIPIIFITITSSSILANVIDKEKSIYSYILSTFLILISVISAWAISIGQELFYMLPYIIFVFTIVYQYEKDVNPSDGLLTLIIYLSFYLTAVSYWTIPILIIFGVIIVGLSIIKEGQIVKAAYNFVGILSIQILAFSSLLLIQSLDLVHSDYDLWGAIINLILALIILGLLVYPFRSLLKTKSRRGDLVSFESNVINHMNMNLITISISFTVLSLIGISLFDFTSPKQIESFFYSITDTVWISFLIYMVTMLIPAMVIMFVTYKYKYKSLLNLIPYLVLMINPVTLTLLFDASGWSLNVIYIFLPEVVVIFLWMVGLIRNYKRYN